MDEFQVVLSYLRKVQTIGEVGPRIYEGGMAPSLSAIETLPHSSFANTDTGAGFDALQRDLIERKKDKKKLRKRKTVS